MDPVALWTYFEAQGAPSSVGCGTNWPGLLISIAALLFTIFGFYWMNFRRGKLIVARPRTFSCVAGADRDVVIHLPLAFYNDGAAHLVAENLRLVFLESPLLPLTFVATWDRLTTVMKTEGKRQFAFPISLPGRHAKLLFCEFHRPQSLSIEAKSYPLRLEARLAGNHAWISVAEFSLDFDAQKAETANSHRFTVFDE